MSNIPTVTPEERKKNLEILRKFHTPALEKLGANPANFVSKVPYTPAGKQEPYIGMFPSEMTRNADIYIEFAHKENLPIDPAARTLYKLAYNPFYDDEFEKTSPDSPGGVRYLVPVSELIVIKRYEKKEETEIRLKPKEETTAPLTFSLPDNETDLPIDQLSIRDFAAIMWKKPVSHKKWLNELIKNPKA